MKKLSYFSLFFISLILIPKISFSDQSQWNYGENKCFGRWVYQQWEKCRHAEHGVESCKKEAKFEHTSHGIEKFKEKRSPVCGIDPNLLSTDESSEIQDFPFTRGVNTEVSFESAVCTTGDHLPVHTELEIKTKFDFLKHRIEGLQKDNSKFSLSNGKLIGPATDREKNEILRSIFKLGELGKNSLDFEDFDWIAILQRAYPNVAKTYGNKFLNLEINSKLRFGNIKVAVGAFHGLALVEGKVFSWGSNESSQLGLGSASLKSSIESAVEVQGIQGTPTDIYVGGYHSCVKTEVGLQCWGRNANGQLGTGDYENKSYPTRVPGLELPIEKVSLGIHHSCAISKGKLYCWGSNQHLGEPGFILPQNYNVPTLMRKEEIEDSTVFIDVKTGSNETCAIESKGKILCWHEVKSSTFELGRRWINHQKSAVKNFLSGPGTFCAVNSLDQAKCWGSSIIQIRLEKTLSQSKKPEHLVIGDNFFCSASGKDLACEGDLPFESENSLDDHATIRADERSEYFYFDQKIRFDTQIKSISAGPAGVCVATEKSIQCLGLKYGDHFSEITRSKGFDSNKHEDIRKTNPQYFQDSQLFLPHYDFGRKYEDYTLEPFAVQFPESFQNNPHSERAQNDQSRNQASSGTNPDSTPLNSTATGSFNDKGSKQKAEKSASSTHSSMDSEWLSSQLGLHNPLNNCFANSVHKLLWNDSNFRKLLDPKLNPLTESQMLAQKTTRTQVQTSINNLLRSLSFSDGSLAGDRTALQEAVYDSLRECFHETGKTKLKLDNTQQDAQEYIDEILKVLEADADQSVFGIRTSDFVRRNHDFVRPDNPPFEWQGLQNQRFLSLSIGDTSVVSVSTALAHYLRGEYFEEAGIHKYPKLIAINDKAPSSIIVSLNRFKHADGMNTKDEKNIEVDDVLNMEFISGQTQMEKRDLPAQIQVRKNYRPTGVICHTGGLNVGHYYTYLYHRDQNEELKWFKHNDKAVSLIGSVLKQSDRDDITKNSYIIIYSAIEE